MLLFMLFLSFICRPLGLARAETIYIHNPSQEVPVTLLSMFTSSRHFYIPFCHRRVSVCLVCVPFNFPVYSQRVTISFVLFCLERFLFFVEVRDNVYPCLSQVIPPRGKASFKLIFLPSEEGNVENTLFINTSSHGLLSYQVSRLNTSLEVWPQGIHMCNNVQRVSTSFHRVNEKSEYVKEVILCHSALV